MSGVLQIDDSVVDDAAPEEPFGNFPGAAVSLHVAFDTGFVVDAADGSLFQSRSTKPPAISNWYVEQFSSLSTDLAGDLTLQNVFFTLSDTDTDGQLLFNDPKPMLMNLPDPTLLDRAGLKASLTGPAYVGLQFVDGDGRPFFVYGKLESLTAVPLPSAAWLLLSGLAGFGFSARRRTSVSTLQGSQAKSPADSVPLLIVVVETPRAFLRKSRASKRRPPKRVRLYDTRNRLIPSVGVRLRDVMQAQLPSAVGQVSVPSQHSCSIVLRSQGRCERR